MMAPTEHGASLNPDLTTPYLTKRRASGASLGWIDCGGRVWRGAYLRIFFCFLLQCLAKHRRNREICARLCRARSWHRSQHNIHTVGLLPLRFPTSANSAKFRNNSAKFCNKSVEFRKRSANIRKQSIIFRNNSATFRKIPQTIRKIPQTTSLKACFSTKFE